MTPMAQLQRPSNLPVTFQDIKEFEIIPDAGNEKGFAIKWHHPKGEVVQSLPLKVTDYKLHRCKED